jgi:leader peptidase (prepilin peptidase)/N-methyltransferase
MEFIRTLWDFSPWLLAGEAALFALLIGSFLNVVIYRLPKMLDRQWRNECHAYLELEAKDEPQAPFNLMVPRSRCGHCHTQIPSWHNIPVVSWLILRGRCHACAGPISIRYPLVELTSAALVMACLWLYGPTTAWLFSSLFCLMTLTLGLIDLDTMLLPDQLTLPTLWIGLLVNSMSTFVSLNDALLGAVIGYLVLWSLYWAFKLTTGKEGMGYGDFKLLAMIGAWFGWQALPLTLLVSSLVGAIIGIGLVAFRRHQQNSPIPFGPYLAIAALVYLFVGESINHWYLHSMGIYG